MNFNELFGKCLTQYKKDQTGGGTNINKSCLVVQDKGTVLLFNINNKGWCLPTSSVTEEDQKSRFPVWASSTRSLKEMLGTDNNLPYLKGDQDIEVDDTMVHVRTVEKYFLPSFIKSTHVNDMKWVPKEDLTTMDIDSNTMNILNKLN